MKLEERDEETRSGEHADPQKSSAVARDESPLAAMTPGLLQRKLARRIQRRKSAAEGEAAPDRATAPTGGGAPLPQPTQQKMERSFGEGFGDVRVHEGEHVGALGAIAYAQ